MHPNPDFAVLEKLSNIEPDVYRVLKISSCQAEKRGQPSGGSVLRKNHYVILFSQLLRGMLCRELSLFRIVPAEGSPTIGR